MRGLDTVRSFRADFYSLVSQIPEGRVSTYGDLARALGNDIAARAVGKMLNQNPNAPEVPCHRVVRSDGSIGGYAKGEEKKKELLEGEGVAIRNDKVVDFQEKLYSDFDSDTPLKRLRRIQDGIKDQVSIKDAGTSVDIVAGVDVSYSYPEAFVALSLWKDGKGIDTITDELEVRFPYIPTFLAFRELPCMLDILEKASPEPDIVMVDGNGIMHPERSGLASHLGVETGLPTIGVAKSQLCGDVMEEVDENNRVSEVRDEGELIGHAVLEGNRAKNPIYVSPGHNVSHDSAVELVRRYCRYKVPQPIRKAHIAAKKRRKKDG